MSGVSLPGQRIAELFDFSAYDGFVQEITLDDLPEAAKAILAGQVRGRLVVRM